MDVQQTLLDELKGSIDFFLQYTNLDPDSPGFGLTVDATKNPEIASIASSGFALTAWAIAAERGHLTRRRALEITRGSLRTLLHAASHHRGFFAHFLRMDSGARIGKSEYSTIDTALCLNGVITAAAYFSDPEISDLAEQLLARVDWNFIVFEDAGRTLFRMAYNPDRGGDYVEGEPGFISRWDMAAEQKIMYFQAAARIDPDTARRLYAGFDREKGLFEGREVIINPGGTLFAYQFSEAWLDAERWRDADGIDWFENTRLASLANRSFCLRHAGEFRTYHENSWGASAGDSPWGYDVSGASPARREPVPNGTVSIYGALSSLPYVPERVLPMAAHLRSEHPKSWGPYGFYDSYNLSVDPPWYSRAVYGIDKGCSLLMIENYLTRLVWETYTGSAEVQKALAVLRWRRNESASQRVSESLIR